MALKKKLFSWLFKGDEESVPEEESAAAEAQEASVEEAPPPDPAILELNRDHALYQLYDLWERQSGCARLPVLRLEDPGSLPKGWLEKELDRLRQAIASAAGPRLTKAKETKTEPKKPQPEGAEPVPEAEPKLPDLNAQPWIFLSADRLAAWIMIFPPVGEGAGLTAELLSDSLRQNEISFGVNEELVARLPEMPVAEQYLHMYLLAAGQPAVDGKDGHIVDFFPRVVERKVSVNEDGQVDYTSLDFVQNANEGDAICQLIPHTDGVPGTTVQGKPIAAKNGKKAVLPKGRNTAPNEDGTKLLATKPGHVEFTGRSFQVEPVLNISGNVDYSTGNISFLGDVHVYGDVCTGFSVRAMGNVQIDGVLEGEVEAGKDLVVAKGILGGRDSIIRAHRNVFAKYMENSSIHVQESLQADCIVNCDVYSDGEVQVLTGRGTIIGGKVSAARRVSAKIVGSKAEGLTRIVLGGLPCAEFERELLVRDLAEREDEMKKTECQPDSPAKLNRLSKIRLQISVNKMKLKQMDKDLQKLKESLEEQEKARLECDIAYAGTEIIIGSNTLRLTHETHKCVARLAEGEIRVF